MKTDIPSVKAFGALVEKLETSKLICVVGDVGVDKYTMGHVGRISPEAPVPVLEVEKEWCKLGLAGNVSHNLQSLGVESTLCGVLGDDRNAEVFEELLEETGLKTWGCLRADNRKTTFKERVTTSSQQICRIDHESLGPLDSSTTDKLIKRVEQFCPEGSPLIIQDYAKGVISKELITGLKGLAKTKDLLLTVDPSRNTPAEVYQGVDLIKPNLLEARILAKSLGCQKELAVKELVLFLADKLKAKRVVVTLGPAGMAMLDQSKGEEDVLTIPTVATSVFDVSGAGDTAMALLTAGLSSGLSLIESAWLANCGAGVVVGKTGTATVEKTELLEFHSRLTKTMLS